jgi:hypothetical protein
MPPVDLAGLPVELEYDVTLDDVVEGQLVALGRSRANRMIQRGVVFGSFFIMMLAMGLAGGASTGFAYPFLVLLGLVGYQRLVAPRVQREHLRAVLGEGGARTLLGRHRLVMSAQKLIIEHPLAETRLRWEGIDRVVVSEHYVHFQLGSARAINVPRRAFPSEQALRSFVETAERLRARAQLGPAGSPPPALPPGTRSS